MNDIDIGNFLSNLEEDMSDDNRHKLIDMRGGCRCFISPPCHACCDPLTAHEAQDLDLIEGSENSSPLPSTQGKKIAPALPPEVHAVPRIGTDYMKAVRDMCGG